MAFVVDEKKGIMKIWIDPNCELCKKNLELWKKELFGKHPERYGSYDEKHKKQIVLELIPDYNSQGFLTHFHIGKIEFKECVLRE